MNKNGVIDRGDSDAWKHHSEEEVNEFFLEADRNKDGHVDFDEFLNAHGDIAKEWADLVHDDHEPSKRMVKDTMDTLEYLRQEEERLMERRRMEGYIEHDDL
eukprot:TRINITY_DN7662_c0_g1_i2.p1 TRINITY_DN7662_c0_g1~~TRINITY_DN7662_c0_g1_i2.p1  ORF type:complete len:102 (-),score=26.47 TRINITY_DN7662_c0_g1_i2:130-435(-)